MSHLTQRLQLLPAAALAAVVAVSGAQLAFTQPTAGSEVIRSFDTLITPTKDGLLDITESIAMDFADDNRHGIRRIIPVEFNTRRGVYKTPLRVLDITRDGNSEPFTSNAQGNDVTLKIGRGSIKITGRHLYKIHYLVDHAINVFNKEPEVYWNATGNDWPFWIERATATLILPPGSDASSLAAKSFVGTAGSKQQGTIQRAANKIIFTADNLPPAQGLTIVARLPVGSVQVQERSGMLWWFMDWWPAVLSPWLALGLVLSNWWSNGRDPGNVNIAGVDWNPPAGLSPAEVGTLVDESCDIEDIVSTLVDLAARGYLKIEQLTTKQFMFSKTDYRFTKLEIPDNAAALKAHERYFLNGLFAMGSPINLSELKYQFFAYLDPIKEEIYHTLWNANYFVSDPSKTRQSFVIAGTATSVIGLLCMVSSMPWAIGLMLSGFIVILAAPAMPAKTQKGVEACRQAIGFQRFVQKAEKERIRVLAKEDPTIFGRLLPYAMVLGAADQWASAFQDLLTQPPDWYVPSGYGSPSFSFSSVDFVNDLGDGMRTCASTFVSTPSPSASGAISGDSGSAGGFSGFSDSGGSSGGGFGGGGGDSW